jgi:TetR/AcrR family transcriptional repressor of mexJK operon
MDAPVIDATQEVNEAWGERAYGRPEKQAAILDAATDVFLREGYERASVDTIAAVANVSKRTIYNHFSDKKELFLAVMERSRAMIDLESAVHATLFLDIESVEERVLELGRQLLRRFNDPEYTMFRRVVTAELVRYPELKMACVEATSPRRLRALLVDRINQANEAGILDVPKPVVAVDQYVALLHSGLNLASAFGTVPLSDAQIDEIATNTASIFLRAYLVRR